VMDAQAELQTPLGFLRCHMDDKYPDVDLNVIEDRLAKTLARLHALLDALGSPMYQPATHPDVPALEDNHG
jgi:hypothetical protein